MTKEDSQDAVSQSMSFDLATVCNKYSNKITLFNALQTVIATAAALASLQNKEEFFHRAYQTISEGLRMEKAREKMADIVAGIDAGEKPKPN